MKIAVIGYSGAGKSTLAKTLSDIYGCPLMYLDTVQFLPGWAERPKKDGIAIVDRFMENKDWVIDGNYPSDKSSAWNRRIASSLWISRV